MSATSEAVTKKTLSKTKTIDSHLPYGLLQRSALKKYPSNCVGCCLANPAEDGSGFKQLELVMKDGFRAVRFNPYLWPSVQQMTNGVGKAMFSRAGELGVPVGFMCMRVSIYTFQRSWNYNTSIVRSFGFLQTTNKQESRFLEVQFPA